MSKVYILAIITIIAFIFVGCNDERYNEKSKSITRNEGIAHVESTVNIGEDEVRDEFFDASNVVPTKEILIQNLEANGYKVTEYDKGFNQDLVANRVYGEKNDKMIDICYGLTEDEAKIVFEAYKAHYTDFYVIAQNQEFVYFVADKETFEIAGFSSLANEGIQLICE